VYCVRERPFDFQGGAWVYFEKKIPALTFAKKKILACICTEKKIPALILRKKMSASSAA